MKSLFVFIVCFAQLTSVSQAELIMMEDFEDGTLNFTVSSGMFRSSDDDYFTIVPRHDLVDSEDPYTSFSGNRFFAAEDIDNGSTRPPSQSLYFNANITGFENITFSMLFAAGGNFAETNFGILNPAYDSDDGFLVRARIDGGAFQNLLSFEATGTNTQTRQDTDFNGVGNGLIPNSSFRAYNGLAIAGTGTQLLVEIIVTSNDDGVEYAFDNVMISGSSVPEPSSLALVLLSGTIAFRRRRR